MSKFWYFWVWSSRFSDKVEGDVVKFIFAVKFSDGRWMFRWMRKVLGLCWMNWFQYLHCFVCHHTEGTSNVMRVHSSAIQPSLSSFGVDSVWFPGVIMRKSFMHLPIATLTVAVLNSSEKVQAIRIVRIKRSCKTYIS